MPAENLITVQLVGGREVQVSEPDRGSFAPGLGGSLEYSLCHMIFKTMEILGGALGTFAGSTLVSFLELVEPELVNYVAPLLDILLAYPTLDENLRTFLEGLRHPEGQAAAVLLAGLGTSAGGAVVGSVISTLLAPVTYGLNDKIRPARTGPSEAWAMFWRGAIDAATRDDWLADQGWPRPAITGFERVLQPRLSEGDLLALSYRRQRNPNLFTDEIARRGWSDDEISNMMELSKGIPGVGDLVRMAVREAWRDDVAARWGYDQDYVAEFGEWMEKQGMPEEWARRYWRAHWELPSLTMAREMVHRTGFTIDDYKDLLRVADIPSGYRDYLSEIVFTPFTRVDVRRMYRVGTLNEGDLIRSYMDVGYNQEKAEQLTDFTIREYGEEEREATKADIVGAYTDDLIARDKATALLLSIEYPDWLVGWFLDRADLAKAKKLVSETLGYVKTMYVNFRLDKTGVYRELGDLNLPDTRVARLIEEWDISRTPKIARPGVSKLEGYFLNDIIDQGQFEQEMGYHKYPTDYIEWAVGDVLRRKKDAADKEEERARKEQERLEGSEIRTDRDLEISRLAVKSAQAKVAIATIQLALMEEMEEEEAQELALIIMQYKLLITTLTLAQAEERRAYFEELKE